MEMGEVMNPWAVGKLEEFLYFCCPECDVRNQSKELFLQHALEHHPQAKECLSDFHIKEEINEEQENIECMPEMPTELVDKVKNENHDDEFLIPKRSSTRKKHQKVELEHDFFLDDIKSEEDEDDDFSDCDDDNYEDLDYQNGDDKEVSYHSCKMCNKNFKLLSSLNAHVKQIHSENKDFSCDTCKKVFSTPQSLKTHVASIHDGVKEHKCDICNKAFTQKSTLKSHYQNKHEDHVKEVCNYCEKTLKNMQKL